MIGPSHPGVVRLGVGHTVAGSNIGVGAPAMIIVIMGLSKNKGKQEQRAVRQPATARGPQLRHLRQGRPLDLGIERGVDGDE